MAKKFVELLITGTYKLIAKDWRTTSRLFSSDAFPLIVASGEWDENKCISGIRDQQNAGRDQTRYRHQDV